MSSKKICTDSISVDGQKTLVSEYYNARFKFYPDQEIPTQLIVTSAPIFNPSGVTSADFCEDSRGEKSAAVARKTSEDEEEFSERGVRQSWHRAKRRAYDYVRCNPELNMFLTLTLSPEKVDRTDWKAISKQLNVWLDNRVRRNGMKYVLCPEYHPSDGESIHFHGLVNEDSLKLVRAYNPHTGKPLFKNGKAVYNVGDFALGFSTALRVTGEDAQRKVAGYIFKYMTKQGNERIGGRYFLAGGDLVKPDYIYMRIPYDDVEPEKNGLALEGVDAMMKSVRDPESLEQLWRAYRSKADLTL